MENQAPTRRLIPVSKWPEFHPWPSVSALRWIIFHGAKNGFESCVRRIGRRVLIDEEAFFAWVEERDQQQKGGGR